MGGDIKLVMFDFDGTLVDSQWAIVAAMGQAFQGAGLAAPDAEPVRRVVGLRLETAVADLLPEGAPQRVTEVAEGYRRAFTDLRRRPDFHEPLFPGIRELLDWLDRPEILLGIATGKNRRGLLHSLERHGLHGRFAVLKTADDGPGKPHPEILERAMAELGVEPDNTAMIGDTTFDMMMARSAGARAVGVSWGYHEAGELSAAGAHCVVETVEAIPSALAIDLNTRA